MTTPHSTVLSGKVGLSGTAGSWENNGDGRMGRGVWAGSATTFLLCVGAQGRGALKIRPSLAATPSSFPQPLAWSGPYGGSNLSPHHFPSMLITTGSALCQREGSHFVLNDSQLLSEARLPRMHTGRCCVGMRQLIRGLNILGVVVTAWGGQQAFPQTHKLLPRGPA